jgi:hypothetical protein
MGKVYRTQLGVKMHCAKNKLPANCAVEVFATNIRFIYIGSRVRRNNMAIRVQVNLIVKRVWKRDFIGRFLR